MGQRVPVVVYARDPVSRVGIESAMRGRPDVWVMDDAADSHGAVAVIVTDEVDLWATQKVKALSRNGNPRVVMVITRIDDASLLAAVECGACGIVPRATAQPELLESTVRSAASGDGSIPPDLLGRLLTQLGRLQERVLAPRGLRFTGLTERETEVLRLVAEGLDTAEVAEKLFFSERTVKNIVHDMIVRVGLRNRTHAVAYALRQGFI